MKRVVVRVYLGDAKTKGNPIAQAVGFLGSSLATPGTTIVDWTAGIFSAAAPGSPTTTPPGSNPPGVNPPGVNPPGNPPGTPIAPAPVPPPPAQ
jgi:hypothetical protein